MNIRKAEKRDVERILCLLSQVLEVHHNVRPDIFKTGAAKYTADEIIEILKEEDKVIFVAEADDGQVAGYCFCIVKQEKSSHILTDIKSLYIDDLCVDESMRSLHIGTALYEHALEYARGLGCYNLTLNVWAQNTSALGFYERLGLTPQKIGMEKIL